MGQRLKRLYSWLIATILSVISVGIIVYLTYVGFLTQYVGIVSSIILAVIYPLLLAILPAILEHTLNGQAKLEISDITISHFQEESSYHGERDGYEIKAKVTSTDKVNYSPLPGRASPINPC